MNRSSVVVVFAALLALSTGANAAQITVDASSMGTNASMANMGMMFLGATDAKLAAIKNVATATKVHVIPVSASDTAGAAFMKAATDMKADLAKLQDALNANTAFKAELAAQKVDVAKVLVVELMGDGTIVLYVMA